MYLAFIIKITDSRDGSSIKDWIVENLKKFKISSEITKIELLCYPRILAMFLIL